MTEVFQGLAPVTSAFSVGDRVTVVNLRKPGHVRTPDYILGHTGEVVQCCGSFLNPEDLSVGRTGGPVVPLYRVQFRMAELWADPQHHPEDTLCIEIYGHWLKAANKAST
jgi:nitrile hydratase subunit beta